MRSFALRRVSLAIAAALLVGACGHARNRGPGGGEAFVPNFRASPVQVDHGPAGDVDRYAVSADGDALHLVWLGNDGHFHYNRSDDAGASFLAADVDLGAHGVDNYLLMCCSESYVHVCWDEGGLIYVLSSVNGGSTWGAATPVDGSEIGGDDGSDYPSIACDGARVYVAWEDERGPSAETATWFNRSSDGGLTWLPDAVQLSTAENADDPVVACRGLNVVIAYTSVGLAAGQVGIAARASNDGGASFGAEIRLDTGFTNNYVYAPVGLDCDASGNMYAAWSVTDFTVGPRVPPYGDMYGASSAVGGASWLTQQLLEQDGPTTSEAGGSSFLTTPWPAAPSVYVNGSNTVVVWSEERPFGGGTYQVRASRIASGLVSFEGDGRIQTNPVNAAGAFDVTVSGSDDNVYATWTDLRDGGADTRFNYSTDGGATWSAADVLLSGGGDSAYTPRVACSGTTVHVAWVDSGRLWVRSSP